MQKSDFSKIALQCQWNNASAWVFFFLQNNFGRLLLNLHWLFASKSGVVLEQMCSANRQQIYRRTTIRQND